MSCSARPMHFLLVALCVVLSIHFALSNASVDGDVPSSDERPHGSPDGGAGDGAGDGSSSLPSPDQVRKMRAKELKTMLRERGVRCDGCVEKSHFVERVLETMHLPILDDSPEKAKQPPGESPDLEKILEMFGKKRGRSKEEQRLIDQLKAQGIDTSNIHFAGGADWGTPPDFAKKPSSSGSRKSENDGEHHEREL